ncbi:TetR/AcrR family transcriptional regulator [Actinacidiphila glaucinigra]|uniref:TetR/AcrR family transcriptional regulator n=1 Tax=Actinacidiphila glaucinigra TaxID=235986 RepID=UPI0037C6248B
MKPSQTPIATGDQPPSPRRRDARRNHARVIAAAVEVFRENGARATVPEIAARARVGKATVYRSFPTKEDLLESVTRLSLEELGRRTATAARATDPHKALSGFVDELFELLARDRLLADRLAGDASPAVAVVLESLTEVMEAARAAGAIRDDTTLLDLRVILCGVSLQLIRMDERDPQVWSRFGAMVIRMLS